MLLAGSGWVLNWSPTLAAKVEQASSMACMEPLVGAVKSTSSAQATAPRKVAPMWHPVPSPWSVSRSSCMKTVNKAGESTEPCLVPFLMPNSEDLLVPQRTQAYCLSYTKMRTLVTTAGSLVSILVNRMSKRHMSKAMVMSKATMMGLVPPLRNWLTVSCTT